MFEEIPLEDYYDYGSLLKKSIGLLNTIATDRESKLTNDDELIVELKKVNLQENLTANFLKLSIGCWKITQKHQDKDITYSFLEEHLGKLESWPSLSPNLPQFIFKNVVDYDEILEIQQAVEDHYSKVVSLIKRDSFTDGYSSTFNVLFYEAINDLAPEQLKSKTAIPHQLARESKQKYEKNPCFIFENLKAESDALPSLDDRIELIEDRLNEFNHWQLNNDLPYYDEDLGTKYLITNEHYPNFVEQCALEKRHLINKQERRLKNRLEISAAPPSLYDWNATDTDLLELATALSQNNALVRKDGKKVTQKEIIEHLSTLFGKEIKDPDGKLKSAVARKKEKAPFLDSLKKSFEYYAVEREG